jgi:glucose/arabinose dehydrogenase
VGFQDQTIFEGLKEPTAIRFAADGRVFVALRDGRILDYEKLSDSSPTVFADLRKQVYDTGDRGILGLALDPEFPTKPYVYVLYTFDHVLGEDPPGAYPHWGQPPTYSGDPCPKPESADVDACPVSGRLVRLTADAGAEHAIAEDVLVEDWCQQDSSHSIGDLQFGPEGALFASGGEGASFISSDYGQFGWPHKNQCGDSPGQVGEALTPPSAEGGSLRSQDVRTPENPITHADPTSLDGSVIRIDPETGAGFPGNPMAASSDPNARRIVAYGFRNPFRFAIDRATDEVYVDNVGNGTYEEIDRFGIDSDQAYNSGWPCYEGDEPNWGFFGFGLSACESLYDEPGSTSSPFFFYGHEEGVTPEDSCPSFNGSAISGSTFYTGSAFPASYDHALFFADSVRGCAYVMFAGADGRPDPTTTIPFLSDAGLYPGIDIEEGPEGDLFYVKLVGDQEGEEGSIHRISYSSGNQPPVGRLTATPEWGASPLTVQLDATGSTDADGETLSYEWDPQGDGSYETKTSNGKKTLIFSDTNNHTIAVRVRDGQGATSVARVTVYPGDTPPQPQVVKPAASFTWRVGQAIEFEGVAHDNEDGDLPATSLDWSSRLFHCPTGPTNCHAHPLQAFPSVGSGTLIAPDHDYPSHIDLSLTATDSRGLAVTKTVSLEPRTVELKIASNPAGVTLTAGLLTQPAPFTLTAIEGSHLTLAAPEAAEFEGAGHPWLRWSDGGDRVHTIEVSPAVTKYSASYVAEEPGGEEEPGGGGKGDMGGTPGTHPSSGGSETEPPAEPEAPKAKLGSHPAKSTRSRTARFAFSANQKGASFKCKLDKGAYKTCRPPKTYKGLKPGSHSFAVIATVGGEQGKPAKFSWKVLKPKSR